MPIRRVRKSNRPLRRPKPAMRRRGLISRPLRVNPQPIFTESYLRLADGSALPYTLAPNAGGVLTVNMDNLPQLAQYSALYQKYRILKAKFICIPTWNTASADANSEIPGVGVQNQVGLSRVVYAVNDSPNLVIPVNETEVLTDNGCKIACGSPKLVMSCRPTPQTEDSVGNRFTMRGRYLNFESAGNAPHFGITWFHTQPVFPVGAGFGTPYLVYVKLTFQLADPR